MTRQESIRRILRESVNESTFFRRRVDMELFEKEFFENLNIITDVYLSKYNEGVDFNFETFKAHAIDYFIDNYYNDLTNYGENDYPHDEIHQSFSNYFYKKIKDKYNTFFGNNINESVDKSEDKKLELVTKMIHEFFDEVSFIDIKKYENKPMIRVYFDNDEEAGNEETYFAEQIQDKIYEYTGIKLIPYWHTIQYNTDADFRLDAIKLKYDSEGNVINESENKKQSLLQTIKKEGLYDFMEMPDMNILDEPLQICGKNPMTGYYRDGYCKTGSSDEGTHTVCSEVDDEFLEFTKSKGNDLSMLKSGDRWCLCAKRWKEAYDEGVDPKVIKKSTNKKTLDVIGDVVFDNDIYDTEDEELTEYSRTLKNARQQGVGLRFPKSAIKSNPARFRPYNR